MPKPKRKTATADAAPTTTPTDHYLPPTDITIARYEDAGASYADAVARGKAIVADLDGAWWRLCELADTVELRWGEKSMEKFFDDVGVDCVGPRRLNVYRAYKDDFSAPGPKCSYSVLRALQTHPERAKCILQTPEMTKGKADEIMKAHRKSTASYSPPPSSSPSSGRASASERSPMSPRQSEKWFQDVITVANTACGAAAEVIERARVAGSDRVEPELRAVMRETISGQEKLFSTLADSVTALRLASEKQQQLIDFFKQLVSEGEDEAEELASDEASLVTDDDNSAEARKALYAAEEANIITPTAPEAATAPVA